MCAKLKLWPARVKTRCGFGGHFLQQARNLVRRGFERLGNLVLETITVFDLVHDHDLTWQAKGFDLN